MELVLSRSEGNPGWEPLDVVRMQQFWLVLARWDWNTLVLLPAHADGSTQELASALAAAGGGLTEVPVSAVAASAPEKEAARTFMALTRRMSGRQRRVWDGNDVIDVNPEPPGGGADSDGALIPSSGKMIISVPSIASDPVSLAATNAADLVILGVELGKTSFKDVSRSIELVGQGRIAGCVLL